MNNPESNDNNSAKILTRWTPVLEGYAGRTIYAKHFTNTVNGIRVSAQAAKDYGWLSRTVAVFDKGRRLEYFTIDHGAISFGRIDKQLRVLGYEPITRSASASASE